jgi:hypothetical protein
MKPRKDCPQLVHHFLKMGRSFKFGMTEYKIGCLSVWILWFSVFSLRTPAVDEIPVGLRAEEYAAARGRTAEIISGFTLVRYFHH